MCCSNHQPIGSGYVSSTSGLILTFFGAGDYDWWRIVPRRDLNEQLLCRVKNSLFYQRRNVFCLFVSSLRVLVTLKELCEQKTIFHTFHNHKWISDLLHNRQEIRISLCWNTFCQDNRHLQWHLELTLDSLQKCTHLDQTTRKRNLFDLQKKYCAPGSQLRIVDIDKRFCPEIQKSFCAGKVYPNTLYLDKTRLQWGY